MDSRTLQQTSRSEAHDYGPLWRKYQTDMSDADQYSP